LRKRRGGRMSLEEANPLWETTTAKEHWHSAIIEGPETAYSRQEISDLLTMAIAALGPRVRVVFVLRVIEEISTTETARILCISSSAVKARLRRARSELKRALQPALASPRCLAIDIPAGGRFEPQVPTRWVA